MTKKTKQNEPAAGGPMIDVKPRKRKSVPKARV